MKNYIKNAITRARFYAAAMGIISPIDALTKNQLMNTK